MFTMFAVFEVLERGGRNQNKERSSFLHLVSLGLSRVVPEKLHEDSSYHLAQSLYCSGKSTVLHRRLDCIGFRRHLEGALCGRVSRSVCGRVFLVALPDAPYSVLQSFHVLVLHLLHRAGRASCRGSHNSTQFTAGI